MDGLRGGLEAGATDGQCLPVQEFQCERESVWRASSCNFKDRRVNQGPFAAGPKLSTGNARGQGAQWRCARLAAARSSLSTTHDSTFDQWQELSGIGRALVVLSASCAGSLERIPGDPLHHLRRERN